MGDRVVYATLAGTALLLLAAAASSAGADTTTRTVSGAPSLDPVPPVPAEAVLTVEKAEILLQDGDLVLDRQRWTFGEASGWAWRAWVPLPGAARVTHSDDVVPFSALVPADDAGPWAAVNGGFYERGPMGLVVSDGVERNAWSKRGGSGIFQWSAAAGPSIVHRSAWSPGPTQAVQSIDRLVDAGKSLVEQRPGARAAARTAVAIGRDRLWLIALADDASIEPLEGSADGGVEGAQLHDTVVLGLPLWTFAEYLADHVGADTAVNMDGAISTQLAVAGAGRRFEIRGERGTINSVLIRPAGADAGETLVPRIPALEPAPPAHKWPEPDAPAPDAAPPPADG